MSQRGLLIAATALALLSPKISEISGFPLGRIFIFISFCSVWFQEIYYIQIKYRSENVSFTRKFTRKFAQFPFSMLKYLHLLIGLFVVSFILYSIDSLPDFSGFILLLILYMTLIRVFDPLLGAMCSEDSGTLTSMIAYLVVFLFAITSALNPSRLYAYSLPLFLTQGLILALVIYTGLNLRMSYYQKFCFGYKNTLESQLRLILIPLLILTMHQFLTLLNYMDFSDLF